jgi:dienelactone hydrolase
MHVLRTAALLLPLLAAPPGWTDDPPVAGPLERDVALHAKELGGVAQVSSRLWAGRNSLLGAGLFGWLHGVAHRAEIQRLVAAPAPERLQEARLVAQALPAEDRVELEGVAQGAQVPLDALFALNLLSPEGARGTTSVVALGRATSMGQALHGVVVEAGPETRPVWFGTDVGLDMLLVGGPGRLGGLAGLGATGLSACVEEFERLPEDGTIYPTPLIVRDVLLRARTLEQAVARVAALPRTHGVRVTIVDGNRLDARVVERRGADVQVRRANEGVLAGCDPDAPLACFDGACDPDVPRGDPSSNGVYGLLRPFLDDRHGTIRMPDLGTTLRGPEATTRQAYVFEPQLREAQVAGPSGWQRVRLSELALGGSVRLLSPATPVSGAGEVKVARKPLPVAGLTIHDVTFASPAPSGFAKNDEIHAIYYEPPVVQGAVIVLPAWKESNLVGQGVLAMALAKKGYAALVLPLPYQVDRALDGFGSGDMTLSADLARTRQAFFQGAADVARASHWLESRGIEPARQAVMGTSLGGHVAALAFGAYPERLGAGVFLLTGGELQTALLQPNRTTGRLRRALLERGVTPEEALPLMRGIDGVTWADPARRSRVLLVGAKLDDVVRPENVKALARAYGDARTEWLEGDHYGILAQIPKTLDWTVDHLTKALAPPPSPR